MYEKHSQILHLANVEKNEGTSCFFKFLSNSFNVAKSMISHSGGERKQENEFVIKYLIAFTSYIV